MAIVSSVEIIIVTASALSLMSGHAIKPSWNEKALCRFRINQVLESTQKLLDENSKNLIACLCLALSLMSDHDIKPSCK